MTGGFNPGIILEIALIGIDSFHTRLEGYTGCGFEGIPRNVGTPWAPQGVPGTPWDLAPSGTPWNSSMRQFFFEGYNVCTIKKNSNNWRLFQIFFLLYYIRVQTFIFLFCFKITRIFIIYLFFYITFFFFKNCWKKKMNNESRCVVLYNKVGDEKHKYLFCA